MILTRVYNSGHRAWVRVQTDAQMESEIAFNRSNRPGVALFREATCVEMGYLGAERCAEIAEELRIKFEEQRS